MAGEFDYWSYLLSLPLHLGTTLDTLPAQIPYLAAPQERSPLTGASQLRLAMPPEEPAVVQAALAPADGVAPAAMPRPTQRR